MGWRCPVAAVVDDAVFAIAGSQPTLEAAASGFAYTAALDACSAGSGRLWLIEGLAPPIFSTRSTDFARAGQIPCQRFGGRPKAVGTIGECLRCTVCAVCVCSQGALVTTCPCRVRTASRHSGSDQSEVLFVHVRAD